MEQYRLRRSREASQGAAVSASSIRPASPSRGGSSRRGAVVHALTLFALCGGIVVAGCTWFLDLVWLQSPLLPAHVLAATWAAVIGWSAFEERRWGLTALAWSGLWIVAAIVGAVSPVGSTTATAGMSFTMVGAFWLTIALWGGLLASLVWMVRRPVSAAGGNAAQRRGASRTVRGR